MATAVEQRAESLGEALGTLLRPVSRAAAEVQSIWDDAQRVAFGDKAGAPQVSTDEIYFAWFAGLGTMASLRVVSWETAAVAAASHVVERSVHNRMFDAFVEGATEGL